MRLNSAHDDPRGNRRANRISDLRHTLLEAAVRLVAWMEARPFRALVMIVLLALAVNAVRLGFDPPSVEQGQTETWWPVALNLIHGQGYSDCSPDDFPFCGPTNQVTAAREPVPVLLFAAVAILTGESLWAAAAVQVLLNLATLIVIFFLARDLAGVRAGLLAALLWAVYLPVVKIVSEVSGDLLATFGVASGLFFFMRSHRTNRARDWLAAGGCIGVSVLSRSAMLIVPLALTVGLILIGRSTTPLGRPLPMGNLRPAALFLPVVLLIMTPWWVRNYLAFGRVVIGSTLTGYNLYRHHYMLSTENYLRYVGAVEGEQAIHALVERRGDLRGTENEAQLDAVYREEALRIIAAYPLGYVLLSAYRFFPLWFDWGIREAYGEQVSKVDYLIMLVQGVLLITAAIGLRGTWPRAWPLAVSILVFSLVYMAVNARLRYLVPVMPLIISLSAAGGWLMVQRLLSYAAHRTDD